MLKLINFAFKPCFLQLLSASLEQFVQEVEVRSLLFVSLGLFCSRSLSKKFAVEGFKDLD
jgi:hypothetical protein